MKQRTVHFDGSGLAEGGPETGLAYEWLVTNGLGGYACGTVAGVVTRRYHGYLVAALPAPFGRVVMLNEISECVELPDGRLIQFGGETRGTSESDATRDGVSAEFHLESGLPVWTIEVQGIKIEKRVVLPHGQNTSYIEYALLSGAESVKLALRPFIHFRPHETPVSADLSANYTLTIGFDRYEISSGSDLPALRLMFLGESAELTVSRLRIEQVSYQIEERRGYPANGELWSPGVFSARLKRDTPAALVSSTESWDDMQALSPVMALRSEIERKKRLLALTSKACNRNPRDLLAQHDTVVQLLYAADQFLITPAGRADDATRAHAVGDEVRTVIAGYHWFTDWGRDTMISLEGLTLSTGRYAEAAWILRTFAQYIRDGLIPNLFPERSSEGLYNTADATLWFFHALGRYTEASGDLTVLQMALPKLVEIFRCHMLGTHFGIHVDPADGLLVQGADGYALTWMDAKMDNWVVTPRRGKAVEINALWYNALRLLEGWLREAGDANLADEVASAATQAYASFNEKFWFEHGRYLYDVIEGPGGQDAACRPNQIFAFSLRYPILHESRWSAVLEVARAKLLSHVIMLRRLWCGSD